MIAKVKSSMFIDAVHLEFPEIGTSSLKVVLKDDTGCICSTLETNLTNCNQKLSWNGLNDLPYGVYTMELSNGKDEMSFRMVKRI